MPTSPNLGITHVEQNQTNKEVTIDAAIDALDEAMTDTADINVASGNVVVSNADYRENIRLRITGATVAGRTVTLPALKRLILITSDSANTQGVDLIRGSTTIVLAANGSGLFYTDGTANGLQQISSGSGGGSEDALVIACSDETTDLTTGTAKITFRMPYGMTLSEVRSSINTVSSSGLVTVDINEGGVSILSTKLSIDQGEKTSLTAATPAVISDGTLADDAEMTIDIDAAGTGAKGLKVTLIGTKV
jgi:hypothetical protein